MQMMAMMKADLVDANRKYMAAIDTLRALRKAKATQYRIAKAKLDVAKAKVKVLDLKAMMA